MFCSSRLCRGQGQRQATIGWRRRGHQQKQTVSIINAMPYGHIIHIINHHAARGHRRQPYMPGPFRKTETFISPQPCENPFQLWVLFPQAYGRGGHIFTVLADVVSQGNTGSISSGWGITYPNQCRMTLLQPDNLASCQHRIVAPPRPIPRRPPCLQMPRNCRRDLHHCKASQPSLFAGPVQISPHDCNRNCNKDSYLDEPPLQAHETGTVIVCGACTNPSASFHASAAWLHANAKTLAAIGTFASLARRSADARTLNCCRDWHVARKEPVQALCRCVRPEMWSRLAPLKGPSQGRPRLNLHRKSPQARAPHMLSESSIMQTLQGFTPVPPCFLPRWYPCIPMQHRFVTVLKHLSASFDARLYRCMPMPEL